MKLRTVSQLQVVPAISAALAQPALPAHAGFVDFRFAATAVDCATSIDTKMQNTLFAMHDRYRDFHSMRAASQASADTHLHHDLHP